MTVHTKCGCESGFTLCPIAERLWKGANTIYQTHGYDAWINSETLQNYQAHMKHVYNQEHYYFNH